MLHYYVYRTNRPNNLRLSKIIIVSIIFLTKKSKGDVFNIYIQLKSKPVALIDYDLSKILDNRNNNKITRGVECTVSLKASVLEIT